MKVSGIGTSYECIYNTSTGKIESTAQERDPFIDYFNGELSDEELYDELNGFDAQRKCDIEAMFRLFNGAERGKLYEKVQSGESFTISAKIIDGETSEYYIDGEKVFTAHHAFPYSSSGELSLHASKMPFLTHGLSYNASENSLRIGTGAVLNLGNGCRLIAGNDSVKSEYNGSNPHTIEKLNSLEYLLTALIHIGDQQWTALSIFDDDTPMLIELLKQLGVDTSKEFKINNTLCEIRDGKLREVENTYVVPSTVYDTALKKYEEYLYMPLSER